MALELITVTYRSTRRVRLSFSYALAPGAFSTTPYEVTNLDSNGADPVIQEALAVPNSPEVVELVLSLDLVSASLYEVACASVPSLEPATYSGAVGFSTPGAPIVPSTAVRPEDVEAELYGIDFMWNGQDLVEEANGDLRRVGGLQNAQSALSRAVESDGLAWAPEYGGQLRRFVDAPIPSLTSARSNVQRCLMADDRVESSSVTASDRDNSGAADLAATVKLIGNRIVKLEDIRPTR